MDEGRQYDVFLSYSSKNRQTADAIVADLERHGVRCWYAPRDIEPGEEFTKAIMHAIPKAPIFVLLYTPESKDSPHVNSEVLKAFNTGRTLIPFILCEDQMNENMEYCLALAQWVNATTLPVEDTIRVLRKRVQKTLGIEDEEERQRREEEQRRKAAQEAERIRREAEEAERKRKAVEEAERKLREAEEAERRLRETKARRRRERLKAKAPALAAAAVLLVIVAAVFLLKQGKTAVPSEVTEAPAATQEATEATTQPPTEAQTQAPTQAPTEEETQATTQTPSEMPTDATTEELTQSSESDKVPSAGTETNAIEEQIIELDDQIKKIEDELSAYDRLPSTEIQATTITFLATDTRTLSKEKLHDWVDPQQVEELVFQSTLDGAPDDAEDLSIPGDGSVLGWMNGNTLILAGEKGVKAPESCDFLFSNADSHALLTSSSTPGHSASGGEQRHASRNIKNLAFTVYRLRMMELFKKKMNWNY